MPRPLILCTSHDPICFLQVLLSGLKRFGAAGLSKGGNRPYDNERLHWSVPRNGSIRRQLYGRSGCSSCRGFRGQARIDSNRPCLEASHIPSAATRTFLVGPRVPEQTNLCEAPWTLSPGEKRIPQQSTPPGPTGLLSTCPVPGNHGSLQSQSHTHHRTRMQPKFPAPGL